MALKRPKMAIFGHFWPKKGQNRPKMAQNGCSWAKKWLKSLKLGSGRVKNGFSAPKNVRSPTFGRPIPLIFNSDLKLRLGPGTPDMPQNGSQGAQQGQKCLTCGSKGSKMGSAPLKTPKFCQYRPKKALKGPF